MTSPTWGERGSAKRWYYCISLLNKMEEKGEGGSKNLKKWVTSFIDSPKWTNELLHQMLDWADLLNGAFFYICFLGMMEMECQTHIWTRVIFLNLMMKMELESSYYLGGSRPHWIHFWSDFLTLIYK